MFTLGSSQTVVPGGYILDIFRMAVKINACKMNGEGSCCGTGLALLSCSTTWFSLLDLGWYNWQRLNTGLHRTRLNDFTFTIHFHALEKEMATHSSVLARRIPGMGEPGGLLSIGSHRVGHDWSDLAAAAAAAAAVLYNPSNEFMYIITEKPSKEGISLIVQCRNRLREGKELV